MTRSRGTAILTIAAVVGLLLWGCAEDGHLMVQSGSALEPTLASIQERIFTPICSACHFPQGTGQFMPLHTADASYENLVTVGYSFLCSGPRVDPGNPDNSCLVLKLEGSTQAGGEPMPPRPLPRLTEEQIAAIRQWILDGAPR